MPVAVICFTIIYTKSIERSRDANLISRLRYRNEPEKYFLLDSQRVVFGNFNFDSELLLMKRET